MARRGAICDTLATCIMFHSVDQYIKCTFTVDYIEHKQGHSQGSLNPAHKCSHIDFTADLPSDRDNSFPKNRRALCNEISLHSSIDGQDCFVSFAVEKTLC
jgi:hypothetical protein